MDHEIRDRLIGEILDGTYRWGECLPSENRLADEYAVPRITVRKALLALEEMGYIYSRQGQGRFLRERQEKIPLNLNGSESFSAKIREAGLRLETSTISYQEASISPRLRENLQGKEGETVYRIERLRIVNGKPIAIHISYLRESLFPDLPSRGDGIESLFSYFQEKGYSRFDSRKTVMSISLPSREEQELLACPPLVPLLVLETDTRCAGSERVLQFTRILYRSDSFQYIIE